MSVTSDDCKRALVDWVWGHPGFIKSQFEPEDRHEIDESLARDPKKWKRIEKARSGDPRAGRGWELPPRGDHRTYTRRAFDCTPFEDQIRGYTWDDGKNIIRVDVLGE